MIMLHIQVQSHGALSDDMILIYRDIGTLNGLNTIMFPFEMLLEKAYSETAVFRKIRAMRFWVGLW